MFPHKTLNNFPSVFLLDHILGTTAFKNKDYYSTPVFDVLIMLKNALKNSLLACAINSNAPALIDTKRIFLF